MLRRNIRDRVSARSSLAPLKIPAFNLIETLQKTSDPSIQIDTLSLVFTLVTQGAGFDPHELIGRARRQIRDASAVNNPHLEAISDYAAGELK